MKRLPCLLAGIVLAACSSTSKHAPPPSLPGEEPAHPAPASPTKTPSKKPNVVLKKGGGFYKDDGPADDIPDNLDDIPDAEPKWEPLHRPATKPYVVLGKEYVPNTTVKPYKARGIASWYGKKFHGQKTSIGEPYDMFAMTAAHPTLALPSYVRVSNPQNGKSVVVRVTDRGPFHVERIIDLSYTAAYKLGLVAGGSGLVDVEAIVPGDATGTTYTQVAAASRPTPAENDQIEALTRKLAKEEAPVQTASTTGETLPAKGVYLQLGAFANGENAETLRNHLARDLDWLSEPLRIYPGNGLHRLQIGPYPNRAEAEKVAERIRSNLGGKPTFIIR